MTRHGDCIGSPTTELLLATVIEHEGVSGIHVIACDADGAAEVVRVIVSSDTLAQPGSLDPSASLACNDSHSFTAFDNQLVSGPTLTNVNDFCTCPIKALN